LIPRPKEMELTRSVGIGIGHQFRIITYQDSATLADVPFVRSCTNRVGCDDMRPFEVLAEEPPNTRELEPLTESGGFSIVRERERTKNRGWD